MSAHPLLIRLVAIAICVAAGDRAVAEMGMTPMYLGNPFMSGWVPEHAPVLRGVLWLDGWPVDGRWNDAAALWRFAILRTASHSYGDQAETKAGKARGHDMELRVAALAHGLRLLGERTGHPEMTNLPFVASGFSRFSGSAQNLAKAMPGRVICFLTGFGISGATLTPEVERDRIVWLDTPSQWLGCEWENIYSGGDKVTILPNQWRRAPGVLRMASMTWRVYHNPYNFAELGKVFIDQAIRLRVPADWDPYKGPPMLRPVREADGWLGAHEGWANPAEQIYSVTNENARIAPFAAFEGDRAQASWILNEPLAWAWRGFNARNPKVRIIAPGHPLMEHLPAALNSETGIRPGEPFLARLWCLADDLAHVEFFANAVKLGESDVFMGPDPRPGQTREDIVEAQLVVAQPGVHALMARYVMRDGSTGWSNPVVLVVRVP